ncbi:hypothetical protein LTR66_011495 [Elasticomyces elasticus]|nr:hypothetical protein LTR66_011495 [Elasticomyces elasticus]
MAEAIELSDALTALLSGCSAQEAAAIIDKLRSIHRKATQSTAGPAAAMNSTAVHKSRSKKAAPVKTGKKGVVTVADRAKRPLNSWMAFRAYYAPIFTSYQQKDISGFLTVMWQTDLSQAKWSILAKAYSMIRDSQGKDASPLSVFLQITCTYIGIIDRTIYLELMGWEIIDGDGRKSMSRRFNPDFATFSAEIRSTTLSADNIVDYCRDQGYIIGNQSVAVGSDTHNSSLTMAAQPSIMDFSQPANNSMGASDAALQPANDNIFDMPMESHFTSSDTSDDNNADSLDSVTNEPLEQALLRLNSSMNGAQPMDATAGEAYDEVMTNFYNQQFHVIEEVAENTLQSHPPPVDPAAALRQTASNIAASGDEHHLGQFDPLDNSNQIWVPNSGDPFNTFNMSDVSQYRTDDFTFNMSDPSQYGYDGFNINDFLNPDVFDH